MVARGIGGLTVRELNEGSSAREWGMDVDEFLTWAAYFSLEPPVETRVDVQTALLLAQAYNMNRGKGKKAKKVASFLPQWHSEGSRREMSIEELRRVMKRHFVAMGGDPRDLTGN